MAVHFFAQSEFSQQLYLGTDQAGDIGHVAAVLPQAGPAGFEIADAISSSQYNASIVFLQQPIPPDTNSQQAFVSAVLNFVAPLKRTGAARVLLWIPNAATWSSTNPTPYAALKWVTRNNITIAVTATQLTAPIGPNLNFTIASGITLNPPPSDQAPTVDAANTATFYDGTNSLAFSAGPLASIAPAILEGYLPFRGANRGCVQFEASITQQTLNAMNWGFQFRFPSPGSTIGDAVLAAPLAAPNPNSTVNFFVSIDPLDPTNTFAPGRTSFAFLGTDLGKKPPPTTVLASNYRTTTGQTINLLPIGLTAATGAELPARLVFAVASTSVLNAPIHLAPEGDFVLQLASGAFGTATLLCGLDGGEYLQFRPKSSNYAGDVLRFTSAQDAYTATFPFPAASPLGPPSTLGQPLLGNTTLTSWATLVSSGAVVGSVAQPSGFHLFGNDSGAIHPAHPNLLGVVDVGTVLSSTVTPYPIVPYAGVSPGDGEQKFSADQIVSFEAQVIGPTRRAALNGLAQSAVVSVQAAVSPAPPTPPPWPVNVATPAGLIVTLNVGSPPSTALWQEVLLGQLVAGARQQFGFAAPAGQQVGALLQQALQTGQLLLVVANALNFGSGTTFENTLTIDDWGMTADVGQGSAFADYANVMIIKGVPGALFDPLDPGGCLVANPSKWTMAETFAAPTTERDPTTADSAQLVNLAQWLQSYFQTAWDDPDKAFFQDFNDIAKSPTWTGIVVLKAKITDIPNGLAGITAGITDPSLFYVHHLALPISQLVNGANGPQIKGSTAVSGLIHYLDPALDPTQPVTVVQPSASGDYDFRLLTLKVLFENAAVKSFSSYAQITLDRVFGTAVAATPPFTNPPYNTLMLQGSYQLVDGHPVYSFGTTADTPLYLASNIITRVEVTGVQMSTQKADPTGDTVSWFGISGFIDFAIVPGASNPGVDIFSFGNVNPKTAVARQGLRFENLGLRLTFPTAQPSQRSLAFVTDQIRFDLSASTPRPGSLVSEFALELQSLQQGDQDTLPLQLGYLPVIADFRPAGLGDAWNGLAFRLNLGTPGALAGKVGFDAAMLLAWSPDSVGDTDLAMEIGIKLPGTGQGAPLISLQNVIKLTMGPIRLTYNSTNQSYILMLTEIALSLLGLLKIPPNGATSFFLFGNPDGASSADGLGWYALYNNEPPEQKALAPPRAVRRVRRTPRS